MQALNAAFFKPNTILMTIDSTTTDYKKYNQLMNDVQKNNYGLIFYIPFNSASLSIEKNVSLWVNDLPNNWETSFQLGNNDLSILLSILIVKNWEGSLSINILGNSMEKEEQSKFIEMIRFPKNTSIKTSSEKISDAILTDKNSDLNIISINNEFTVEEMVSMVNRSRISSIFCMDSGYENAFV